MGLGRVGRGGVSYRVIGVGGCVATALVLAGCGGADVLQLPGLGPSKPVLNITPKAEPQAREVSPGEAKAARARLGEAATLAAARSNPRDIDSVLAAARIMRRQGDKPGALALLDTAAPVAPDDARLLRDRGLLALELGALARARTHLKKAVANGSRDWQTRSALGTALAAAGDQKAAQQQFAEALKQAPNNPVVLNNLALSMAFEGRRAEAEEMLRRAAGSQPKAGDKRVAQNLALVGRISKGDGKAAIKPLERSSPAQSSASQLPAKDAQSAAATSPALKTAQVD